VRIVLDATSEVGQRAGRVLMAERELDFLGLWDASGAGRTRRSGPVDDVAGFDVVVSDRAEHLHDLAAHAAVAGTPLVMWIDDAGIPPGQSTIPLIVGANVGSALGDALSHHPMARPTTDEVMTIAWTEPGRPRRRGVPAAFPDPVGMIWSKERAPGRLAARTDGEWGGASVVIEGDGERRIVGVSDHAAHLEGMVLAATAWIAGEGAYPSTGVQTAADAGAALLDRLMNMELDVAAWRSSN